MSPINLDTNDQKILKELDYNARQQFSIIATSTGLSKQVVQYRVERMLKNGIIMDFLTFIDMTAFGYTFHNVGVKLKTMYLEKHAPIIQKLKKIPQVGWLVSCQGKFTFFICILARNPKEFNKVLNNILALIGHYILEYEMFIVIDAIQLPYRIFKPEKDVYAHHKKIGVTDPHTLKASDIYLLQELATNARIQNHELAEKLACKKSTITYKMQRLEKSGLIQGYKPVIDMSKLDFRWFLVFLQLKHVKEEEKKKFITYLKTVPQMFFIVSGVGNWMMHLEFYLNQSEDIEEVMSEILKRYPKIVKDFTSVKIRKEHKCVFFPMHITPEDARKSIQHNGGTPKWAQT